MRVTIRSGGLALEGLLDDAPGRGGVVVTHPHPLYGGDMGNNVVEAIVRAYRQRGYTSLRFNFRGVGKSEGAYGEGMGEQEDVGAALAYLEELGKTSIDLAGYSFGAWVNALGLAGLTRAGRMVMVSPPVNSLDFSFLKYDSRIRLVIAGSADDIAPPAMIAEMLPLWNEKARMHIVEGADHFYWGKTGEIERAVMEFLESDDSSS